MKSTIDWFELIVVVGCLLFAITISLFHLSFPGWLSLSDESWGIVWAVGENGLSLFMCIILSIVLSGKMRLLFRYVLIPYFILKLVYYISCYSGIVFCSVAMWENIWSAMCVGLLILGLLYCLIVIRKRYVA